MDDIKLLEETKQTLIWRFPQFADEVAKSKIEYRRGLKYKTAATDGKDIFVDPDYFASLNKNQRLFLLAHEFLHNMFFHPERYNKIKKENKDFDTWNEAADAVINANLQEDGFEIIEDCVNMPEAINYTSEEFYKILMERKKNQQNENGESGQCGQGGGEGNQSQGAGGNGMKSFDDYIHGDHSAWDENEDQNDNSEDKEKNGESESQNDEDEQKGDDKSGSNKNESDNKEDKGEKEKDNDNSEKYDEKKALEENRKERKKRAKMQYERMASRALGGENFSTESSLGKVGKAKAVVDWKLLLRKEIEKDEYIWSQRRSIAENNYAYRIEDYEEEDEAVSEIILDVSCSVGIKLLKSFLRQIKTILKDSKIKVGTFSDYFHGFQEIKTDKDIDDLKIHIGGGTNFDAASKAFSKKPEVNRICFTDGCDGGEAGIQQKRSDIIWISFWNKDFHPDNGTVIYVPVSQIDQDYEDDDEYSL